MIALLYSALCAPLADSAMPKLRSSPAVHTVSSGVCLDLLVVTQDRSFPSGFGLPGTHWHWLLKEHQETTTVQWTVCWIIQEVHFQSCLRPVEKMRIGPVHEWQILSAFISLSHHVTSSDHPISCCFRPKKTQWEWKILDLWRGLWRGSPTQKCSPAALRNSRSLDHSPSSPVTFYTWHNRIGRLSRNPSKHGGFWPPWF